MSQEDDEFKPWKTLNEFVNKIVELASESKKKRILVGIAGPAGSGKSTLARHISNDLNQLNTTMKSMSISMDGFHYYQSALDAMDDPEMAKKRRGAPFTFDVERFIEHLKQLNDDDDDTVWFPDFDHGVGDPVERAVAIQSDVNVVIVEGLYVLLDMDRWRDVAKFFDCAAFLDVSLAVCEERLLRRHMNAWHIDKSTAQQRIDCNDTPNNRMLMSNRIRFDDNSLLFLLSH